MRVDRHLAAVEGHGGFGAGQAELLGIFLGTKSRALIASGASALKCRRRRGSSMEWAWNL